MLPLPNRNNKLRRRDNRLHLRTKKGRPRRSTWFVNSNGMLANSDIWDMCGCCGRNSIKDYSLTTNSSLINNESRNIVLP